MRSTYYHYEKTATQNNELNAQSVAPVYPGQEDNHMISGLINGALDCLFMTLILVIAVFTVLAVGI